LNEIIRIHSRQEKRGYCDVCQKTFAFTKGSNFYRLRTDPKIVITVVTLLAFGCPVQAIVRAFGFDERTIKAWHKRAGKHCQHIHEQQIHSRKWDLLQVAGDVHHGSHQIVAWWCG
jgi:transposase-like protein